MTNEQRAETYDKMARETGSSILARIYRAKASAYRKEETNGD